MTWQVRLSVLWIVCLTMWAMGCEGIDQPGVDEEPAESEAATDDGASESDPADAGADDFEYAPGEGDDMTVIVDDLAWSMDEEWVFDDDLDDDGDDEIVDEPGAEDPATDPTEPAPDDTTGTDTGGDAPDTSERAASSSVDGRYLVEMTWATANIGRNYGGKPAVAAAIDRVGDVVGSKSGPRFIGWQEIGEADPCGSACEWDAIKARFKSGSGWANKRPSGVHTPITSRGANDTIWTRRVFASPGWAGVSPTRYVTVAHYKLRNVSVINTHFIAGAWSCKSNVAKRKDYWHRAWKVLKQEVAAEIAKGRNVIVTGDLNRPRSKNSCNPQWDPTNLHNRATIVGGGNIDYIFAVPAHGYRWKVSKRNDGSAKRGSIHIGIDGHKGYWVTGRFREN